MAPKRLFIAIAVPPEIRSALSACKNSVSQQGLSWVKEENLHITVLFMGDTPDTQLPDIEAKLAGLEQFTAFPLQCKQIEAVRRRGKTSMIWAGFERSAPFVELATKVSEILSQPPDHAPLPHITLARVKHGHTVKVDTRQFPAIAHLGWQVQSVGLWASVLTPAGSIYTILREWQLQKA